MSGRYTLILASILIVALAFSAYAATPQKPAPPKTISLELTDVTIVEAFQRIFKGTNVSYIIQPGVSGTISSLNLKDVPFENALNSLAKAAGLEVTKEEGIYLIGKSLPKSDDGQVSVVARPGQQRPHMPDNIQPVQGEEYSQDVVLGQYPVPMNPQYQMGPGEPVYYGHYPQQQQGYYYNQNQGYRPGPYYVSPPAYQLYKPNLLPPPGTIWSAGIGEVDIVTPQPKTPTPPTPETK